MLDKCFKCNNLIVTGSSKTGFIYHQNLRWFRPCRLVWDPLPGQWWAFTPNRASLLRVSYHKYSTRQQQTMLAARLGDWWLVLEDGTELIERARWATGNFHHHHHSRPVSWKKPSLAGTLDHQKLIKRRRDVFVFVMFTRDSDDKTRLVFVSLILKINIDS